MIPKRLDKWKEENLSPKLSIRCRKDDVRELPFLKEHPPRHADCLQYNIFHSQEAYNEDTNSATLNSVSVESAKVETWNEKWLNLGTKYRIIVENLCEVSSFYQVTLPMCETLCDPLNVSAFQLDPHTFAIQIPTARPSTWDKSPVIFDANERVPLVTEWDGTFPENLEAQNNVSSRLSFRIQPSSMDASSQKQSPPELPPRTYLKKFTRASEMVHRKNYSPERELFVNLESRRNDEEMLGKKPKLTEPESLAERNFLSAWCDNLDDFNIQSSEVSSTFGISPILPSPIISPNGSSPVDSFEESRMNVDEFYSKNNSAISSIPPSPIVSPNGSSPVDSFEGSHMNVDEFYSKNNSAISPIPPSPIVSPNGSSPVDSFEGSDMNVDELYSTNNSDQSNRKRSLETATPAVNNNNNEITNKKLKLSESTTEFNNFGKNKNETDFSFKNVVKNIVQLQEISCRNRIASTNSPLAPVESELWLKSLKKKDSKTTVSAATSETILDETNTTSENEEIGLLTCKKSLNKSVFDNSELFSSIKEVDCSTQETRPNKPLPPEEIELSFLHQNTDKDTSQNYDQNSNGVSTKSTETDLDWHSRPNSQVQSSDVLFTEEEGSPKIEVAIFEPQEHLVLDPGKVYEGSSINSWDSDCCNEKMATVMNDDETEPFQSFDGIKKLNPLDGHVSIVQKQLSNDNLSQGQDISASDSKQDINSTGEILQNKTNSTNEVSTSEEIGGMLDFSILMDFAFEHGSTNILDLNNSGYEKFWFYCCELCKDLTGIRLRSLMSDCIKNSPHDNDLENQKFYRLKIHIGNFDVEQFFFENCQSHSLRVFAIQNSYSEGFLYSYRFLDMEIKLPQHVEVSKLSVFPVERYILISIPVNGSNL